MTEETPQAYAWHRVALLAVLTVVAVAALLPAVIPPRGCGGKVHGVTMCAHHLSQLYKLGTSYNTRGKWPTATGEDLWLGFAKVQPPLIDESQIDVFFCPVRGEEVIADTTDYRGPASPVLRIPADHPLGADKPGNHGAKYGGNVLFANGSVQEHGPDDPEWRRCEALLRP